LRLGEEKVPFATTLSFERELREISKMVSGMHSVAVLTSGRHSVNTISEMVLDLPEVIGRTERTAIWKSKEGARRVTVIGDLGVGSDGRHYVSVLDARAGLPVDELEF
jgi:hypothetical protein